MIRIAIDGTASSGKGTLARRVAKSLGFYYIDTGAMYRAAALFCIKERLIDGNEIDERRIPAAIERMYIAFKYNSKTEQSEIHLGGVNVEKEIRSMEVARRVSLVAAVPEIRHKLVNIQQRMASVGGVVMDGRDIGTVVMPKAELKFFITADLEIRARRRFEELKNKGVESSLGDVLNNIRERDRIDTTRAVAPLRKAKDSIVMDNSNLSIDEQFDFLLNHARKVMSDA